MSSFLRLVRFARACIRHPVQSARAISTVSDSVRGSLYAKSFSANRAGTCHSHTLLQCPNPLTEYFNSHRTGKGIWKWEHYFPIYHRHFQRFVNREVHIVEIGIFSGGSLPMWHEYFGHGCHVYGVDIEPACAAYQDERTSVFIGDQADRGFWGTFRQQVPTVDIVIDDGGHLPEQQIITLEELLPHVSPGGVYLCEDAHGVNNPFVAYIDGLTHQNDAWLDKEGRPSAFQEAISSVHRYPYVTVIEKCPFPRTDIVSTRRGTEWQPFL
jgi:SAM-dependent methyltransferase